MVYIVRSITINNNVFKLKFIMGFLDLHIFLKFILLFTFNLLIPNNLS